VTIANLNLNDIVTYLESHQLLVVTAESCTAGLIASTLAEPPGCGAWLDSAFVTYSENAKIQCLNVREQTIEQFGLTSEPVARAMAESALAISQANLSIATTGVAGPSPGDGSDPVGKVCIAWAFSLNGETRTFSDTAMFHGERNDIREQATVYALNGIQKQHTLLRGS